MRVKLGNKSVLWLFLKVPLWISISIESSQQDLFIDMAVDTLISNNNQITLSPVLPSYLKQALEYT